MWVEGKKLFGNMSLANAIASFLHLAFVFDLKYPKVCFVLYFISMFELMRTKTQLVMMPLNIRIIWYFYRMLRHLVIFCRDVLQGMGQMMGLALEPTLGRPRPSLNTPSTCRFWGKYGSSCHSCWGVLNYGGQQGSGLKSCDKCDSGINHIQPLKYNFVS